MYKIKIKKRLEKQIPSIKIKTMLLKEKLEIRQSKRVLKQPPLFQLQVQQHTQFLESVRITIIIINNFQIFIKDTVILLLHQPTKQDLKDGSIRKKQNFLVMIREVETSGIDKLLVKAPMKIGITLMLIFIIMFLIIIVIELTELYMEDM